MLAVFMLESCIGRCLPKMVSPERHPQNGLRLTGYINLEDRSVISSNSQHSTKDKNFGRWTSTQP